MDYIAAIEANLKKSGLTAAEASRRAVGNPYFLYGVLKKGQVPSVQNFEALCRVLDLEFYVGPPRGELSPEATAKEAVKAIGARGQLDVGALREHLSETQKTLDKLKAQAEEAAALAGEGSGCDLDDEGAPDLLEVEYVEIHEVAAAVGSGAKVEDTPVVGYVAFQRTCLDLLGADPTQCTVIRVKSESMEPTLPSGCWILVDRGRRRRLAGHIYFVRSEEELVVKRLGKDEDGRWQLESDHPGWEAVPWPDGAEVIGEVKWTARMLPGRGVRS